jgi:glycine cleavage system H protein
MNKYHAEHTWVRVDADASFVGITQHAQETLGDIVFVDFAESGQTLTQGSVAGVVESVKAAADVHMPVTATILEVNEELRADPSLANSDPEGAGWFYKVSLSNPTEIESLMDPSSYQAFLG